VTSNIYLRTRKELYGMSKRKLATTTALAVLLAGLAAPANAALQLQITTGGATDTVVDGGSNDACPLVGCITFVGMVGGSSFSITTGTSKPVVGPAELTLNSVDISGVAGQKLILALSDTGFVAPAPTGPGLSLTQRLEALSLPGTASVSVQGYQSNSNKAFDRTGATSGVATVDNSNPFTSTSGQALTAVAPYSLTEVAQITFGTAGIVQFNADLALNPEPGGLVLVGGVLIVVSRAFRSRTRTNQPS
jgi:hypothetical protein